MKYLINNYVDAFLDVLDEIPAVERASIVPNFIKLLKKNGDISHKDEILNKIQRKAVSLNGGNWVIVELAREASVSQIDNIKKNFSKKDRVEFKLNPSLVAGVRVTINGDQELDNSLNNKLKKLFK